MAVTAERGANAFKAFRQVVAELRKADKSFTRESAQFKYMLEQMKDHQITQRIFSKAPNEMEHVTHLYATYLTSTRRLAEFEDKYSSSEKSVEESARLVGLTIPKRKDFGIDA